ncbi:hypothetical protein MLD38_006860 [Melastoma candidum]|uniref:Uncharacterized protein n=1 Tax=Melastoma candidum TaxID=119954 RepID=A0ACB9RNY7_9MYRT|nr:hypothetical protein MLD38_006860 [Melastoma candidum]
MLCCHDRRPLPPTHLLPSPNPDPGPDHRRTPRRRHSELHRPLHSVQAFRPHPGLSELLLAQGMELDRPQEPCVGVPDRLWALTSIEGLGLVKDVSLDLREFGKRVLMMQVGFFSEILLKNSCMCRGMSAWEIPLGRNAKHPLLFNPSTKQKDSLDAWGNSYLGLLYEDDNLCMLDTPVLVASHWILPAVLAITGFIILLGFLRIRQRRRGQRKSSGHPRFTNP